MYIKKQEIFIITHLKDEKTQEMLKEALKILLEEVKDFPNVFIHLNGERKAASRCNPESTESIEDEYLSVQLKRAETFLKGAIKDKNDKGLCILISDRPSEDISSFKEATKTMYINMVGISMHRQSEPLAQNFARGGDFERALSAGALNSIFKDIAGGVKRNLKDPRLPFMTNKWV